MLNLFKKKEIHTIKLAIMASGRGSNFEAIFHAVKNGKVNAEIALVISDNPKAMVLQTATKWGIPNACYDRKNFSTKEEYENTIVEKIIEIQADLVVLAGYMKILGSSFINVFKGKIVNIHPALLPAFPGLNAQKQALDYGARYSGCTVHFVDEGVDTGPIILQRVVPVLDTDTEQTLSQRILTEEHDIYWKAIKLIADGKLKVEGRRVVIR